MTANVRYTEAPHDNRRDKENLKAILPYLQDYSGRVVLAVFCLILSKLASVCMPVVLKYIVDGLSGRFDKLAVLPLGLLLAYGLLRLGNSLFNELRDSIFARVRYGAMRQLSRQLIKHLYDLSLRFHLERETGAISRDLERGTRSASSIMNYLTFNILPTAVELSLVIGFLVFNYNIFFTIVTIISIIIYVLITLAITEWRMHFRHTMNAMDSQANNKAIDGLINYETVKYFGNEEYEVKRYNDTLLEWEEAAVKSQTSMSVLNFAQSAIIAIAMTIIMVLAVHEVMTDQMTIGDLVLVNAFLLQLFLPLNFLGIIYRQLKYSLADMDLLFRLLKQTPEVGDSNDAQTLKIGEGLLEFKKVSFHYQEERNILNEIDFIIKPGTKLAVVGASGSGKSTLVRLLFRFYDVSAGRILIDGQDVKRVSQKSLRQTIGIVPQDTVLFNDSLRYNIMYGRPNCGENEMIEAAKMAHIHEFIQSLPEGYDTVVGERGLKLSGGEKQRVAIARVVLKNPKILIFDEATSALDTHSEQAILGALGEVAKNHTTLVIAHRLSTIVDAQEIIVLQKGKLVERGSHQQLLAMQGIYTNMWQAQQKNPSA